MPEIFFILGKRYLLLPAGFSLTLNIARNDNVLVPIIKIPERAWIKGIKKWLDHQDDIMLLRRRVLKDMIHRLPLERKMAAPVINIISTNEPEAFIQDQF